MQNQRHPLNTEDIELIATIASKGSFAEAARFWGLVPSALSYRVRVLEDRLDVLLFDRGHKKAMLTEAGKALVHEGSRIQDDLNAVVQRIQRIATGWEADLTIAVDSIVNETTIFELAEAFLALSPPTRLRFRTETLSGT